MIFGTTEAIKMKFGMKTSSIKKSIKAGTYNMSLKNVLIIVDNIDESIDFYEELFGLRVITRQEGNVIMSEGLVLQDFVCEMIINNINVQRL